MQEILHDLLDIYPRSLTLLPSLGAAMREWDPEAESNAFPDDSEIRGFGEFEALKSLYVDTYEALARALTVILGVVNLKNPGDVDAVARHPRFNKKKPFAKDPRTGCTTFAIRPRRSSSGPESIRRSSPSDSATRR